MNDRPKYRVLVIYKSGKMYMYDFFYKENAEKVLTDHEHSAVAQEAFLFESDEDAREWTVTERRTL